MVFFLFLVPRSVELIHLLCQPHVCMRCAQGWEGVRFTHVTAMCDAYPHNSRVPTRHVFAEYSTSSGPVQVESAYRTYRGLIDGDQARASLDTSLCLRLIAMHFRRQCCSRPDPLRRAGRLQSIRHLPLASLNYAHVHRHLTCCCHPLGLHSLSCSPKYLCDEFSLVDLCVLGPHSCA